MAHSTKINHTIFIHNGDYSGDVEINNTTSVPFRDLAQFVANYVTDLRIEKLEQASADDVLFGRVK